MHEKVTLDEVRHIAGLARLRLTEAEEVEMVGHLEKVLAHCEKLADVDTDGVAPMAHVADLENVIRTDEVTQRISTEEALKNAPDADHHYFRVPKVIK